MKHFIIGRAENGFYRYQGWPTVCIDEQGVLYTVCSGNRLGHLCVFGKNFLYKSSDGGKSWTPPMVINDTYLDDRDAGITYLGGGKMLLTYFCHPWQFYAERRGWVDGYADKVSHPMASGLLDGYANLPDELNKYGSFVRLSQDYGNTWDEAVKVPVTAPHGPIKLKNGKLFFLGKEFHSGDETLEQGAIYAFESSDDGKTWQKLCGIDFPEGLGKANMHEPHAIELPDGTLLGAIRAQGEGVPHKFSIFTCTSTDGGKSFSHPECLGISGSPPHLMLHSSGALILTYGRREAPFGERIMISRDGGKTWGEEHILTEAYCNDLGYPATVELEDGSLVTVYYERYKDDKFTSILGVKWRIEEFE